jgi:PIN domain nuclease of toxin-antitoxin system
VIVLDTHVLLWWFSTPERLSARARRAVTNTLRHGQLVASVISVFEIATASRRGRLQLGRATDQWLADLHKMPELRFEPLSADVARAAGELPASMPGDPADRMIAATALSLGASLVTADRKLRKAALLPTIW